MRERMIAMISSKSKWLSTFLTPPIGQNSSKPMEALFSTALLTNEKGTALTQAEKQFFADAHDIEKPEGHQKQGSKKSAAKKWTLETGVSIDQDEKDAIAFAASLPNLQLTIAAKDGFGFLPAQPPEIRMNS